MPGPTPKDLSAYLEEAHEERRRFPKLSAHATGKRIAARHPEVKGLDQAIRKALRKEEKQANAATPEPSPPAPPPSPPSSPVSPPLVRPVGTLPRRRFKSATQRAQEEYQNSLSQRLKVLNSDLEKLAYAKRLYEQDERAVEALMNDPAFMTLWRMLQEDED